MNILTCENVSFSYEGETVVSDINFSLKNGDFLSVIGENGSGKTTLIKGILGLLKPDSGKIIFSQKNKVGYLPQKTQIQSDFPASVYEVVISGCQNSMGFFPFYTKKEKESAEKNLSKLKISDLKNKCFHELSGGQQQKVLLARALCAAGSILLLDEPVTGLDPEASKELYTAIKKLNKEDKMTVIMVSHDIENAVLYSDYILHLQNKPLFFGSTDDYKKGRF